MKKKLLAIAASILLITGLAACGTVGQAPADSDSASARTENTGSASSDSTADTGSGNSDTAVFYFSATGTTKGVAEKLAKVEKADLYEIVPAEPYTDKDLDWNNDDSRTTREQNDDSIRPEITGDTVDISGYDTIYIGYPIWWGEEPRIMDTFAESYDFGDSTVIPFCTSGGSSIGSSGDNLEKLAGTGNWKDGERLEASISDGDLKDWADSAK